MLWVRWLGGRLWLIEAGDTLVHTGTDCLEEVRVLIVEILIHDSRVFLLVSFLHLLYEFRECLGYCLYVLGGERKLHFMGRHAHLGIATLGSTLAYVLRLNAEKNTIVLGNEQDLLTDVFFAEQPEWVNEDAFFSSPSLAVRIRYHATPVACTVQRLENSLLLVRTAEKVSAVTPGQSAVFYEGERLVGGAVIANQKGIGQYV